MKRLILLILFTGGIITTAWSQSKTATREVIVQLKPGTITMGEDKSEASVQDLLSIAPELRSSLLQFNADRIAKTFPTFKLSDTLKVNRTGQRVRLANLSNIYTIRLPSQAQRKEFIEQLSKLPFVIYAEPNGGVALNILPNDEYFDNPSNPGSGGQQWSLLNTGQNFGTNDADIDAPEAWDINKGSSSTTIGIIDCGVENWHEDLSGKVTGDSGWSCNGHGFHVAGIAAAKANNSDGIAGVDWNAQIISQRIDIGSGDGDLFNTVMDAVNGGSHIINNSWRLVTSNNTARYSTTVRKAFANAYKMNVVATVAMGNSEGSEPGVTQYPAGFGQGIIAVGNTNRDDQINPSSSTGDHIDVSAPGTSILSTVPYQTSFGYYDHKTGTSMSTPHVSGIAGLLLSENPNLYNDDIENIIRLSAEDVNAATKPGFDNDMGAGRVNAHKALQRLQSSYVLQHNTASGGFTFSSTNQQPIVFFGVSGLSDGGYLAKRYEIRKTISFSYLEEAHVWCRGVASKGFSAASPNFGMGWCEPISSPSHTGVTLRTYTYKVYTTSGQFVGWFPTSPSNVEFAYTVHGDPGNPPPAAPTGITITNAGTSSPPAIDWNDNTESDLSHYQIWRQKKRLSDGYTFNAIQLGTTTNSSYTDFSVVMGSGDPYDFRYFAKAVDTNGGASLQSNYTQWVNGISQFKISSPNTAPKAFSVNSNYPNPFNPSTTIKFGIPEQAEVQLEVFNVLGRKVQTLVNESRPPGFYTVRFNGQGLASGIYIARLTAVTESGQQFVKDLKMQMIK